MTTLKHLHVILFLGVFSFSLFTNPVELDSTLTPNPIEPGQHAVLRLKLPFTDKKDESELQIKVFDDLLLDSKDIIILQRKFNKDGNALYWEYELTSHNLGKFNIPPIQVQYEADTFSTERLTLEVITSRPENDKDLRNDYEAVSVPLPWNKISKILFIVLGTLAITYLLYTYLKRIAFKKIWNQFLAKIPVKKENPKYWLKKELARLKKKALEGKDLDTLPEEWSYILKTFLSMKEGKQITASTSQELTIALSKKNQKAMGVIIECDLFKFKPEKSESPTEFVLKLLKKTEELYLCGR